MSKDELKALGSRISSRRKQLGLTQEQLAERMNVSIQMISNLERGNKAIKIENLINLSKILSVSTDYILTGDLAQSDRAAVATKLDKLSRDDYKMIDMLVEYCLNK